MNVQTYLFFEGCCEQAIQLYCASLGAEVMHLSRFADAPRPLRATAPDEMVFHSTLRIGETFLNLCDDPKMERGSFGGFALLVHFNSPEDLDAAADGLARSGSVDMAAQQTMWADRYAIVTDAFGITWKLQYTA